MRISDWSSDVCSSDLLAAARRVDDLTGAHDSCHLDADIPHAAGLNVGPVQDTQPVTALAIGLQRMCRQIEADGVEFVLQLLLSKPILDLGQHRTGHDHGGIVAEQADLSAFTPVLRGARMADQKFARLKYLLPVRVQAVECPGPSEIFELPFVTPPHVAHLEERRVGKEWVSTGRSRVSPYQ